MKILTICIECSRLWVVKLDGWEVQMLMRKMHGFWSFESKLLADKIQFMVLEKGVDKIDLSYFMGYIKFIISLKYTPESLTKMLANNLAFLEKCLRQTKSSYLLKYIFLLKITHQNLFFEI